MARKDRREKLEDVMGKYYAFKAHAACFESPLAL
jgi:hypothetical protein